MLALIGHVLIKHEWRPSHLKGEQTKLSGEEVKIRTKT
jgi:hypothetical protein